MRRSSRVAAVVCALLACARVQDPEVVFYIADGYEFTRAERSAIRDVATTAVSELRLALPSLPTPLVIRISPGSDVMPETGENGTSAQPDVIYWTVDPHRPGGAVAIARRQLRGTIFHEAHHLLREAAVPVSSLMDRVVEEGMATVFERDVAKVPTPWGSYPHEVRRWVEELRAQPSDAPPRPWLSRHPDGRRWIGYKAGAYLVDRAARSMGKSSAELVATPTDVILEAALR